MKKKACFLLVCGAFLTWGIAGGLAQDNGNGMTTNPKYKFWASFKPGANSTYTQATKFHGAEKSLVPGGIDHKTITYRLLNTSPDKVVVLTTVVEEDFLSTVESAPTRITFPAMVKKANLDAVLQEWSAKEGEDEIIKVGN